MNRRKLFRITGAGLASAAWGSVRAALAPQARPPNLLFLLVDQQRLDTLRVYGNRKIIAPNLNRLADQSIAFSRYYVSQPVCTPSRGCLLTGLYPHTHGSINNNIPLNSSLPVLVEMFQNKDYATAYFGKWHLGDELCPQHGFQEFETIEDGYTRPGEKTCARDYSGYFRFLASQGLKPDSKKGFYTRDFANQVPKELSKPAYLAMQATQFLERHQRQPWVLYVSSLDPHDPFHSVNDHLYNPADLGVPKSFSQDPDATELERTKTVRAEQMRNPHGPLATAGNLQEVKARYWGKITLVDEMYGRILAKLEALGLADNTLIVFTTDHGEMMGDHRLMFKSVMYEEAANVPLLLRIPWLQGKSQRIDKPVAQVDLVPTLLELMGQPVPRHLQGFSWAPFLLEGRELPDRNVMLEWNGQPQSGQSIDPERLRTIITPEGWKMNMGREGAGELFHLNDDPREMVNLFYREESLRVIRLLTAEVNLWQRSTGDAILPFDEQAWTQWRKKYGTHATANGLLD
ncbi:MAG: sulfatase-like hydrolase/transferase [Terriglobia bacterium]